MQLGDKVHIPAPEKSNPNWSVYRTATVAAIDGDSVTVRLTSDPSDVRTLPRDDVLTPQQFQAYLTSYRNAPRGH